MRSDRRWSMIGLLWTALVCAPVAAADRTEPSPKEAQDVDVVSRLGATVPGDLAFTDAEHNAVKLGQFFDGKRPVLLTLNYSNCPKLCSLQLNGLFEALTRMTWNIGQEFQMVTVSIDPKESVERAAQTKEKYLRVYERADRSSGWHWLVGSDENIHKVADAVGFRYKYDPVRRQYAHPAVTIVCSPDGRVMRYLKGIVYDPQTLRLALVEASEGKIGTWVDGVVLRCFDFDEASGSYAMSAMWIMRAGGIVAVLLLGGLLFMLWRRERRRTLKPASGSPLPSPPAPLPQAGEG